MSKAFFVCLISNLISVRKEILGGAGFDHLMSLIGTETKTSDPSLTKHEIEYFNTDLI